MGRRSGLDRHLLVPLLALVLIGASAAVPASEQEARRVARAALDRGELKAAQTIIDGALARFGKRDDEAVWALRVMRGEVLIGLGDGAAARAALAFELPAKLRTSETAVRLLIMQMYVVADRAEVPRIGEKARTLAKAHAPGTLADVLIAIANTQTDVARSEALAREAIGVARKGGTKASNAKAMATLARALSFQQRFAESVQWGEQALTLAGSVGNAKTLQQIEGNLGWSYFELGDYETAAQLFTQAEATAARIDAKNDRVPWLIQLGNIRHMARDWAGAVRYNEEAIAVARPIKHAQLKYALANAARAMIELGRLADARRYNAEALEVKRAQNDDEAELASHIIEARIAAAEGKYAQAQKLLEQVLRETKQEMTVAEAAVRLAQVYVRTNRRDLAESAFKRAQAAAHDARAEVTNRDLRFSLGNTTAEIFGEYVEFLAQGKRIEDALLLTETERAQTLEEGLAVPAKIDARAIARQHDATILCYWLGRDRSYLWVVTKNDIVLYPLQPDTTIEKAVDQYRNALLKGPGTIQSSGHHGESLYRLLVPATVAIAKSSRVIVVADRKLHTLNFETLVVPAPRRYWINDVVVMNASSLQLLVSGARKPAPAPAMLLVGDAPSPDPAFPLLRYADAEMRAVEKRFPRPIVLEGAKATPAAYLAAAPGRFDYIHFVAHGVATRKRPLDSAVILARDPSSRYKLLARDVIAQPLSAKLVTISSCHGAGTRTYAGEGVVGLAWAFLRAGADQVIAALWEVNDAATPQLMDRMYAAIRAGKDPAVALREAKLQLVNGQGSYRNPRYWAPFVLYL
jgi:CHAT domain-containing protein